MKKTISMMIALAMLIAMPLSVMAQVAAPEPGIPEDGEIGPEPAPEMPPYWYYMPEPSGFDYSGGVANGTYVDFVLDETTGTITDYTATLVDYNYFYPMVYYADGREGGVDDGYFPPEYNPEPVEYVMKFFDSISFANFVPNGHPGIFNQNLVFMGENVMMTFSDYEYSSMMFQFGESNDSMTFTVPAGWTISETPRYYELYGIDDSSGIGYDDAAGGAADMGYDVVDPGYGYYNWDEAYLTNGNISCTIWVDRGTIEILGNEITVTTYPGAYVSTSSWIEYGWTYEYQEPWFSDVPTEGDKGLIEDAMDNGLMAAVGYLFMGEGGNQYDNAQTMNDPSFQLEFQNVEANRFQVRVDSDIETGRIVTLNVNKEALNAENMNQVSVLLDNENVKPCGSIEDLVDLQGGTEAGYYMVSGNSQNTIFVYVPHFSTHIISVGLTDSQLVNVLLPGTIAVAFLAGAVGLVYLRGKRGKDEL